MKDEGAELVLGIVAPVGADLDQFTRSLEDCIKRFRYVPRTVRLSGLLSRASGLVAHLSEATEFERLITHMDAGNELRTRTDVDEILALWAVATIHNERPAPVGRLTAMAWLIRSLKHPDEVRALRAVYGPGFYLIGVAVPDADRRWNLRAKGLTDEQIELVVKRDKAEDDPHGQHMRDAYELADVYIEQRRDSQETGRQIERFLNLAFGKVVETPTVDEHAMFLAYASAIRSGDLSRQVGAVIRKDGIGVVATGCNDVPMSGGGLYCMDALDQRDHVRQVDANEQQRAAIVADVTAKVMASLRDGDVLKDAAVASAAALVEAACRDSRVLDITEYGRPVHAEMDALLTCGRAGISTRDAVLYSTTYPCHNCAKHIIAAGIRRVVYVEPYEKSQATHLHGDAISTEDDARGQKVVFQPFVGVGPRRFFDLFAMRLGDGYPLKRKRDGVLVSWTPASATIRVPLLPTSYVEREAQLAKVSRSLVNNLKVQP